MAGRFWFAASALAAAIAFSLSADGQVEPRAGAYRVVGDTIPAPLTGARGEATRGRSIVVNRYVGLCLLCHSGPFPEERSQGTIGPDLTGVGSRLSEGQIRLRLVDPVRVNPAAIMPPYYRTEGLTRVAPPFRGKTVLSAEQIEDVVAFLSTLRD